MFDKFQKQFKANFEKLAKDNLLYRTDVQGDELWEVYLSSFPAGTDPIYKERTEHTCNCCKSFIRHYGNIVYINENYELVSIWEFETDFPYNKVVRQLAKKAKSAPIKTVFVNESQKCGTEMSLSQEDEVKRWYHLSGTVPKGFVISKDKIPSHLNLKNTTKEVFMRTMSELTIEAAESVIELIDQGSLYRGEEFKSQIVEFVKKKKEFDKVKPKFQSNWCWANAEMTSVNRLRNTAIGTLLIDLSKGEDLDVAVRKFEAIMAPTNYKRPNAIFTKKMIQDAQTKINELGYADSLERRHARPEDITINNVLFVDRSVKPKLGGSVFDELLSESKESPKDFSRVDEISIEAFLASVLPNSTSIEVMVENDHEGNFMNLIAPVNKDAPSMFKWDNNFSWAYNGDITDSMKQRVKAAGGKVDGVLRYSIQWNDDGNTPSDYDAHCVEPSGNHIYYCNKLNLTTRGNLDVDIMWPTGVAVENITWPDLSKMKDGEYVFSIHNFNKKGGTGGFSAEIEFGGTIWSFNHPRSLKQNERVEVARVTLNKGQFKITQSIPSTQSSKEIFGVKTNVFTKASMVLLSPNHWDDNRIGNKHVFFILDGAYNPNSPRGFFNEFLNEQLTPHKRVFEALGSKMRVVDDPNQLCGVGFSSTQSNSVVVRTTGNLKRVLKVKF